MSNGDVFFPDENEARPTEEGQERERETSASADTGEQALLDEVMSSRQRLHRILSIMKRGGGGGGGGALGHGMAAFPRGQAMFQKVARQVRGR